MVFSFLSRADRKQGDSPVTGRKPYHGVIFVSKPRCASTSIFEHVYDWNDSENGGKPLYHSAAIDMISAVGVPYWVSVPSFAMVRHPEELVKSWYMHHKFGKRPSAEVKSQYPETIDEWIEGGFKTHWDSSWTCAGALSSPLPQRQWVDHRDQQLVTMVIRLEDMDWTELEKLGVDMSGLPVRNNTPEITSPLSKGLRKIIEEHFSEDYERFSY